MANLKKQQGNKKIEITKQDILLKLKWFHGEEIHKYPLDEELMKL